MGWTRSGIGYDVHRLVGGRPLVLGGVRVPHDRGLEGHSDADVVCHAIADALLGALALGDLGQHFPSTDPELRGISSLRILERVTAMLGERRAVIANVDVTIIAEEPRLAPHNGAMRAAVAGALGLDVERVSIKATTHEGVGALGRGEAVAALAIAQVEVAS